MFSHGVLLFEFGEGLSGASLQGVLQVLRGKLVPANYSIQEAGVSSAGLGRRSGSTKPGSGGVCKSVEGCKFVAG